MDIPNHIACLICSIVGFGFGYFFRSLLLALSKDDVEETPCMPPCHCIPPPNFVMTEIDHELETAILSWTRDEFIGYHVMILENKDDPGVRLVTIYDVDDSETVSTTKRVWEIINICESDYNVDVRKKFVYIPNIHSHSNTKRFFPHYERAKTV